MHIVSSTHRHHTLNVSLQEDNNTQLVSESLEHPQLLGMCSSALLCMGQFLVLPCQPTNHLYQTSGTAACKQFREARTEPLGEVDAFQLLQQLIVYPCLCSTALGHQHASKLNLSGAVAYLWHDLFEMLLQTCCFGYAHILTCCYCMPVE